MADNRESTKTTKARIKIPNKRPWSAFSGTLVDRQIVIFSPKNYNL